nr:hypothetical protein B0A51_10328 [Rachicladosporium sp. CCFEE 5018]
MPSSPSTPINTSPSQTFLHDASPPPPRTPSPPSSEVAPTFPLGPDGRPLTNLSRHPITAEMVFAPIPNREYHEGFMRKAIAMAEMALASDETPVGCVFVREGEVIGRGINGTNASLCGTRHAEFVALAEIMSKYPQSILRDTDLYVTVEPCIMCASALRQYGIRTVYFGCLNDRFGGTGGVMTVHMDEGVDPPFPVYGGLFREEAIMLLRRFYVQENDKAPEPKPKKNRELKTEILPIEMLSPNGKPLPNGTSMLLSPKSEARTTITATIETPPILSPMSEISMSLPGSADELAPKVATVMLNGIGEAAG